MLDEKSIEIINDILAHDGTVEIRKRKSEIVIVEVKGKIKHKVITGA